MARFFFLFFLLSFQFSSFSQKGSTFKGTVKDLETKALIPFATVILFNGENTINGVSSDENGVFEISSNKISTHLEIHFMGYEVYKLNIKDIKNFNAIEVLLKPSGIQLNEVVVKSEQTITKLKIDRKIINLGADLQQSGATILEAFNQIPEIQTDLGTGTISLRGSGNVRILINGKPSALTPTEALSQINAASVDRIEIITSPSAKNQADGLSGIINIILKKELKIGLNTTVNLSTGTKRYGSGITGNYNFSKVNIRLNSSYEKREMDSKQWIQQLYTNQNTRDFYAPHDFRGNVKTISSGIDFFIDKTSTLSFGLDYTNNFHRFFNNTFYSNVTNREDYVYVRNSSHTHKTTSFNSNYRKEFENENHFLELDYNLARNKNILPASDFEDGIFLFDEQQDNENTLHQFVLDYSTPISKKTILETGFSWNHKDLESFNFFQSNGGTSNTERFNYKEVLWGVYALTKFNLKKLSIQTGVRYEHFISNSNNTLQTETTNLKFKNVFPSVHFSYAFENERNLSIGYSKRVSRPSFRNINPFQMGNQYFQWNANPNLSPEFSDNIELNYQHNGSKFDWSVSTFYRSRNNVIQWLRDINSEGVETISFDNIGQKQSYGIEGDIRYKHNSYWDVQLSGNYYHTDINQDIALTWYQVFSSSIVLKNSFKFTENIRADITYRHTPTERQEFSITQPRNRIDLAIRGNFFEKRFTTNLRIIDLLNNNLRKRTFVTQQVTQQEIWRFQSQTFGVLLSMSYQLFQNKKKT